MSFFFTHKKTHQQSHSLWISTEKPRKRKALLEEPFSVRIISQTIVEDSHHFMDPQPANSTASISTMSTPNDKKQTAPSMNRKLHMMKLLQGLHNKGTNKHKGHTHKTK